MKKGNGFRSFLVIGFVAIFVVCFNLAFAGGPTVETITDRNPALHLGRHEFHGGLSITPPVQCDWDFPSLGSNALDTVCAETDKCYYAGAAVGDACLAASNLGADAGLVPLLSTATLSCRAVTNAVVFKLCAFFTDGGAYDLGDAGFSARIIR